MRISIICLCFLLSGCTGVNTAMQYDYPIYKVKMPDDIYRIYEHPKRDRLMTTPSLNKAFGQGFATGATFGLADVQTPEKLHEAAARKHLDNTGRSNCVIVRGYLLVRPQYEFFFECPSTDS